MDIIDTLRDSNDEEESRLIADLEQLVQKSQAASRELLTPTHIIFSEEYRELIAIAKMAGEQSRATRQALTKYRDHRR